MSDRLIELALETLELRRAALQAEIEQLRAQLKSQSADRAARAPVQMPKKAVRAPRRPRSASARKAQSQRMKEFWARKRAEAAGKNNKPAASAAKKNGKE